MGFGFRVQGLGFRVEGLYPLPLGPLSHAPGALQLRRVTLTSFSPASSPTNMHPPDASAVSAAIPLTSERPWMVTPVTPLEMTKCLTQE